VCSSFHFHSSLTNKSPTQSTDSLRHCLCAINSLYELSHAENDSKLTNRNRSLIGVLKDTLPTKSHASPVSARKQFINSIMVTNSFHFNGRLRFQQLFPPSAAIHRATSPLTFIQFIIFLSFLLLQLLSFDNWIVLRLMFAGAVFKHFDSFAQFQSRSLELS
jgi:hypothetical protein